LDIDQKMIEVPESRLHIEISQFGYLVFIGFEVDEGWVVVIICGAWYQQCTVTVGVRKCLL
jgi:hypothetical protein